MITVLDNLTFAYRDEILLENVNATINDNDRIGLIGENGSGKTTLINLIVGRLYPLSGKINTRKSIKVGYLEQTFGFDSNSTVMEEMEKVFEIQFNREKRMNEIAEQISVENPNSQIYKRLSNEYSDLKKKFEGLDGYNIHTKIKTVLNGLGFLGLYDRVISTFSGGEKTRLAIAKLLLEEPDILILDEPTNHLDFQTLNWLENYLSTYKNSIFVVSHDRFFLDRTVKTIWELENRKIIEWKGNYTEYKIHKAEYLSTAQKEYDKQQIEIAKMKDYIARNLERASTAKSAQSRVKKLESMDIIEKPILNKKKPSFHFEKGFEPTKTILEFRDFSLSAGEKTLFTHANFEVRRNEKVAIVGDNGTGKSTLLRKIISCNGKDEEKIFFGKNVTISYYDQENLNLNFENSVIDEMWDKNPRSEVFELRKALGRMLIFGQDIEKKVKMLSGGERAKLGFAIMMMRSSNFLIMDEPTNHIDLETREALEDALIEFDGTVLFVSHDRYFLSKVANKIINIENEGITCYNTTFEEYQDNKKNNKIENEEEEINRTNNKPEKKKNNTKYLSAKERKEKARKRVEFNEIEKKIASLEEEMDNLNKQLIMPSIASDYKKANKISSKIATNENEMNLLIERWEELGTEIE